MIQDMNVDKKYILIALQILFFIIIILPIIVSLNNPIFFFPILILEFVSFIPLLLKKDIRFSMICWIVQFYLAIIIGLIIQPETILNIKEVSDTARNTLLLLTNLAIIPLLSLLIFKEKSIKPILFGLSTGTTIVVILIVGFIISEGLPVFEETNPIDFITGEEWSIQQDKSLSQVETLKIVVKNYDVELIPENDVIYRPPNTLSNTSITIKNTGGLSDEYFIDFSASQNLQNISLSQHQIYLDTQENAEINISFFSNNTGRAIINLTCTSNNSDIKKSKIINIFFSNHGVELSPNTFRQTETQMSVQSIKLNLRNTGIYNEEYNILIKANDNFRPFITNANNWDYENNTGIINLDAKEKILLNLKPNLVTKLAGNYNITVEVQSKSNPEIKDESKIFFKMISKDLFAIIENKKTIAQDQQAIFNITTDIGYSVKIQIKNLSEGFSDQLLQNDSVIFSGQDQNIVNLTQDNNNLLLIITAQNLTEGTIEKFSFELKTFGGGLDLGILQFLIGSFATTLIAILIAAPLGIGVAIFLSEFCQKKIRPWLRFLYDLLAGIPSVVYGLFGFLTFGPLLGHTVFPFIFGVKPFQGGCVLTASLILSLMILPIIIALSQDAIQSVEKGLKEGSLALGATRWQTMKKVILPSAKSGIIASIILAVGRAIGETMAVSMIMGGSTGMPDLGFPNFFLDRVGTMTSEIALNFGWAVGRPESKAALFAMATVLFFIVFILNGIIFSIRRKSSKSKHDKNNGLSKLLLNLFKNTSKFKSTKKKKNEKNQFNGKTVNKLKNTNKNKFMVLNENNKNESKNMNTFIILNHNNNHKKNKNKNLKRREKNFANRNKILSTTKKSIRSEQIVKIILMSAALFATLMLFYIIADIIIRGGANLEFHYFTNVESFLNPAQGGFANAIVGSLQLVLIALLVAAPLSIGAALYIVEYAKKTNIFTRMILFTSDTLASTPSIVFGAFGYIFFIHYLDFNQSLLIGGFTLGFMVIPLLLRSSIEALKSIPDSYREGSLALGATKWQTIKNAVIPPASPSISSGVIISIGRAIGETAAIIFTAGYFSTFAQSLLEPVASMPNLIWNYYSQSLSFPELGAKVYSAAMVLLFIVIILNIIAKLISLRAKRMMKE